MTPGIIRMVSYLYSLLPRRGAPVADAVPVSTIRAPLEDPGPAGMWVQVHAGIRDHKVTYYGTREQAEKFFGGRCVTNITRDELRYLIDE